MSKPRKNPAALPSRGSDNRAENKPADSPNDKPGEDKGEQLTRADVARILGKSTSTVIRLEGTRLHPRVVAGPGGSGTLHVFERAEVLALRESWARDAAGAGADDTRAAQVFKLLDAATHPIEIVEQTGLGPDVVQRLTEQWDAMGGRKRWERDHGYRREQHEVFRRLKEGWSPREVLAHVYASPERVVTWIALWESLPATPPAVEPADVPASEGPPPPAKRLRFLDMSPEQQKAYVAAVPDEPAARVAH